MERNKVAILTTREWDYIQSLLARKGTKFDWYLIKKIDSETGGCYGKNYTW